MKYAITVGLAFVCLALAACGGDDDDVVPVPSELAEVCGQVDATLSPEVVEITEPVAGGTVRSPLTVAGKINAFGQPGEPGTFWIALVLPDGTHLIDYPARVSESGSLVSFEQQVPFSYFESTSACVWIQQDDTEGAAAKRIPVIIEPQGTESPAP